MPLLGQEILPNLLIGYWHIQETEAALMEAISSDQVLAPSHQQALHRRQYLSGRLLTRVLLRGMGLAYGGIEKDTFGRPLLRGHTDWQISLSHSADMVAVALSYRRSVGLDIQVFDPKIERVVGRVLSLEELRWANTPERRCIGWCAKEALYKWHGKGGLSFREDIRMDTRDPLPSRAWVRGYELRLGLRRVKEQQVVFCR
ncbi:MAG: 4'-phosphopantetheinyl transferase family protein [Bernardetiaceae bacterium]